MATTPMMSERQAAYIDSLVIELGERALSTHDRQTMTKFHADNYIEWLLKRRRERDAQRYNIPEDVPRPIDVEERQPTPAAATNGPEQELPRVTEIPLDKVMLHNIPALWVVKLRDMLTAQPRQVMEAIAELNRVIKEAQTRANAKGIN